MEELVNIDSNVLTAWCKSKKYDVISLKCSGDFKNYSKELLF